MELTACRTLPLCHGPEPPLLLPLPQVERVLAGEAAEEEMLASSNYFQTRLAPMVEGSVGSNQQQQQGGTDPGAQGASEGGSGECAAAGSESCSRAQHDASEL